MKRQLFYALLAALMLFQSLQVSGQSGGSFEIKQSVIASGGGTTAGGIFSIESTIGQPAAGTLVFGGNYSIYSGYGQPFDNQCLFSLSASSINFASIGGNASPIQVSSTPNCNWTAVSNDNWITVNSGANGTGNGSVVLNVAANGGAPRSGTVTIAGLTFTVNQNGTGSAFFTISGSVLYATTPVNQATKFVPNVSFSVQNSAMTTTSDSSGNYALNNLPGGNQYVVSAAKTGDVNAINSLDATRIQQHLVGITTLSPGQLAAADVNNSGTVNSLDATRLQQYLVGIQSSHAVGQWKFLPSTRQYNAINSNAAGENYQAVLLGEVSGNWTTSQGFAADETENAADVEEGVIKGETNDVREKNKSPRRVNNFEVSKPQPNVNSSDKKEDSMSAATVSLPNFAANTEKTIEIPVMIAKSGAANVEAFDFTVFFDPAVLQLASPVGGKTGTLSRDCSILAYSPAAGSVKVSAACAEPIVSGQGTLFVLRFNVLTASGQTAVSFRDPLTNQNTFFFNENVAPRKSSDGTLTVSNGKVENVIAPETTGEDNR